MRSRNVLFAALLGGAFLYGFSGVALAQDAPPPPDSGMSGDEGMPPDAGDQGAMPDDQQMDEDQGAMPDDEDQAPDDEDQAPDDEDMPPPDDGPDQM